MWATADPDNLASLRVLEERSGLTNRGLTDPVQTWRGLRPRVLFTIEAETVAGTAEPMTPSRCKAAPLRWHRTSAGLLESDLAWAPTHTLINLFTEVVDHSAATSILAAGRWNKSGRSKRPLLA